PGLSQPPLQPCTFCPLAQVFHARAMELKAEGNQHFQAREYAAAMERYGKAIKLLPASHADRAILHSNRAACLLQMRPVDYEGVRAECDVSLSLNPGFCRALLRRAKALDALGEKEKAEADVDTILKTEPANQDAWELKKRLQKLKAPPASKQPSSVPPSAAAAASTPPSLSTTPQPIPTAPTSSATPSPPASAPVPATASQAETAKPSPEKKVPPSSSAPPTATKGLGADMAAAPGSGLTAAAPSAPDSGSGSGLDASSESGMSHMPQLPPRKQQAATETEGRTVSGTGANIKDGDGQAKAGRKGGVGATRGGRGGGRGGRGGGGEGRVEMVKEKRVVRRKVVRKRMQKVLRRRREERRVPMVRVKVTLATGRDTRLGHMPVGCG
ncbi:unnamed protein product, partial [Closterium sp. NIES-54]